MLPATSTSTSIQAKTLWISNTNHFMPWCNCNKKISSIETKIVECTSCGLKQRPASPKKHRYFQALFQHKKGTVNLTLFDDTLKQVLGLPNAKFESITQDELDDKVSSLPEVCITYNNKTKIVLNIEKQQWTLIQAC